MLKFLQNTHNRHPTAHLENELWGVFCEFKYDVYSACEIAVTLYATLYPIALGYNGTQ